MADAPSSIESSPEEGVHIPLGPKHWVIVAPCFSLGRIVSPFLFVFLVVFSIILVHFFLIVFYILFLFLSDGFFFLSVSFPKIFQVFFSVCLGIFVPFDFQAFLIVLPIKSLSPSDLFLILLTIFSLFCLKFSGIFRSVFFLVFRDTALASGYISVFAGFIFMKLGKRFLLSAETAFFIYQHYLSLSLCTILFLRMSASLLDISQYLTQSCPRTIAYRRT